MWSSRKGFFHYSNSRSSHDVKASLPSAMWMCGQRAMLPCFVKKWNMQEIKILSHIKTWCLCASCNCDLSALKCLSIPCKYVTASKRYIQENWMLRNAVCSMYCGGLSSHIIYFKEQICIYILRYNILTCYFMSWWKYLTLEKKLVCLRIFWPIRRKKVEKNTNKCILRSLTVYTPYIVVVWWWNYGWWIW